MSQEGEKAKKPRGSALYYVLVFVFLKQKSLEKAYKLLTNQVFHFSITVHAQKKIIILVDKSGSVREKVPRAVKQLNPLISSCIHWYTTLIIIYSKYFSLSDWLKSPG